MARSPTPITEAAALPPPPLPPTVEALRTAMAQRDMLRERLAAAEREMPALAETERSMSLVADGVAADVALGQATPGMAQEAAQAAAGAAEAARQGYRTSAGLRAALARTEAAVAMLLPTASGDLSAWCRAEAAAHMPAYREAADSLMREVRVIAALRDAAGLPTPADLVRVPQDPAGDAFGRRFDLRDPDAPPVADPAVQIAAEARGLVDQARRLADALDRAADRAA